jgi:hypothetical protein
MKSGFLAFWLSGLAAAAALPSPASAQNVDAPRVERAADVLAKPIPVTPGDIVDRPYRVIGHVDTFVQKALWQPKPSDEKAYRELWERARHIGADAVVHATVGMSECSLYSSCGGRRAGGEAIHFLTPAELAVRK